MTTNRLEKELSRWDLNLLGPGHTEEPTNKHPRRQRSEGPGLPTGPQGAKGRTFEAFRRMVNSQVALKAGRSTLLCHTRVEARGRAGKRTE